MKLHPPIHTSFIHCRLVWLSVPPKDTLAWGLEEPGLELLTAWSLEKMCWVIIRLHCEAPSFQLNCIWTNASRRYRPVHLLIHPATSISALTSSLDTSDPVPLGAMRAHGVALPPPCLTDDVVCFGSWAVTSPINSWFCKRPKNRIPELGRLF